jgi:hypothetical protein
MELTIPAVGGQCRQWAKGENGDGGGGRNGQE